MKGIVFAEFIEMIEEKFSPEMADQIITESDLPSEGAYTALGTYDHNELVQLVVRLSETTNITPPQLILSFGEYLFSRFVELYPQLFENIDSSFSFLKKIDNFIHVEVQKLYADAELPSFRHKNIGPDVMCLIYESNRPFADLAEGLIRGCVNHYNESIEIKREDHPEKDTHATFTLTRSDHE